MLGEFNEGAWVSFPISVAAGGTVTITVDRTFGPNAVLSGIFLGDAGAPPAPPVSSAPQGNWVGTYGATGYDLAGFERRLQRSDVPAECVGERRAGQPLPVGAVHDRRAGAAEPRTKAPALPPPYTTPTRSSCSLSFNAAYSGNLELYALDWDSTARREMISVNGQTAVLSSSFNLGAWVSFPVSVQKGETVTITVDRLAGANAVLSGIFLG